jgi:hypothetical protein
MDVRTKWRKAIAGLLALCGAGAIYVYFDGPAETNVGFLVGYNLPFAAIGAVLYWLATKDYRLPGLPAIGFFAIYATMIATCLVHTEFIKREASAAIVEIQRSVLPLAASAVTTPSPPNVNRAIASSAGGDVGEISKFIQTMAVDVQNLRRDYQAALRGVGWANVLDANRLQTDPNLAGAKKTIRDAQVIVAAFQRRDEELVTTYATRINALAISEASRAQMLQGFRKSAVETKKHLDELWQAEKAIVGAYGNVVDFLAARRSSWQVSSGKFMFVDDRDLANFQTLAKQADSARNYDRQLVSEAAAQITSQVEGLKKVVNAQQ